MAQPKLSAQIGAMIREMFKDVRGTLHETFFGRAEHPPEMGAPGNPTPQIVTQAITGETIDRRLDRLNAQPPVQSRGHEIER